MSRRTSKNFELIQDKLEGLFKKLQLSLVSGAKRSPEFLLKVTFTILVLGT